MEKVSGLSLIITFVDRKVGKKVTKILSKNGCKNHTIFIGKGTAPSEIYEFLGVGIIEKDVVLSIADSSIKDKLLELLTKKFKLDKPGHGIACSIPLDGIDSLSALQDVLGEED